MAFSSTAVITLTGDDLITEAMEIIGVLAEGESPSTAATTSALRTLNNIIKMWSADYQIYAQGEYQLNLVASTASYTLDTNNVGYIPQKVINASLLNTSDNTEKPLFAMTQDEWYRLSDRTSEGTPNQYYFKREPVGVGNTLYVWPVPEDTTYDINLWLQYPLRDLDASTDDVWFTQEWYQALVYELAFNLSNKYGLHPSERQLFKRTADEYLAFAASYDVDGSVYLQPDRRA